MAARNRTRLTGLSFLHMARRGFTSRRRPLRILIAVIAAALIGGLVYLSINRSARLFRQRSENTGEVISISSLWDEGRYGEVAVIAESRLLNDPMDHDALLFAGYSRFFLAISRLSAAERNADLDSSIGYLRLLKARGDTPNPERVDYVLGKAYLYKGPFWSDLAVDYLMASLEAGYDAIDIYEHMGRAYSEIGRRAEALEWYEKAARSNPTDRLLITLGEEAFELGSYDRAAEYYRMAIEATRDDSLEKRGLSQLGQLYYDVGNYTTARGVLESLVEMEPGNEDYQFLLGETYLELGMTAEARRAWHAAARINPRHIGALRRLYD